MNCEEAQGWLTAYVDGELDLVRSVAIEKHLESCRPCARAVENQQSLRGALASGALYYQAPPGLQPRIQAALGHVDGDKARPKRTSWWIGAIAAGLLLGGIFVGQRLPFAGRPAATDEIAQEILDSHLRSLMPGHLADVQSSDRHTVKPWFNGKLDFSPPAADFAEQGFPLVGGRLDSIQGRAVAVLVYRRSQHTINVYLWLAGGSPESRIGETERQGYNLIHWTQSGMSCWLASDLNSAELEGFATLFRASLSSAPATP